jgi:hypothetical protein
MKGTAVLVLHSNFSLPDFSFNKNCFDHHKVMVTYWKHLGKERIHLSFPGGLLRLPRAFSATLTGRIRMGTVRMGAEGMVGTERLILTQHSPYL